MIEIFDVYCHRICRGSYGGGHTAGWRQTSAVLALKVECLQHALKGCHGVIGILRREWAA